MPQKGAGYLHPACAGANVEAGGGTRDELIAGVRANSRILEADLAEVLAQLAPAS